MTKEIENKVRDLRNGTMFGYTGKIARIDLSSGKTKIEAFPEEWYRQYMGGRNIGLYFLLKELKPKIDPLSLNNKLIFSTSMLTGTPIPGSSRYSVVSKSPLTGGYGEAEAGGWFGPELKAAGFDALIIEGKAKVPVYLWIHNGQIEIKNAGLLWGKTTGDAQRMIRKELGDDRIRIAQIGPSGEKLIKYACIVNELVHVSGRCGLGAVMGAKNLRAIAVHGNQKVKLADSTKIKSLVKWFTQHYKDHPGCSVLHDLGTAKNVIPLDEVGMLPTENFRKGSFKHAARISGEEIKKSIRIKMSGCYACPVRCKPYVAAQEPFKVNPEYGGPEYETIGAFGSICGVGDAVAIAKAHEICNKYGLDTISTGLTIAFVMECFQQRLLKKEEVGFEVSFGDGDSMVKLTEMIAKREGIGDLLAEGMVEAAKKIDHDALKYAMQVKGQAFSAHEPRGKWGVALGYAVSPTGADHLQAAHDVWFTKKADKDRKRIPISLEDLAPLGIVDPVPVEYLGPEKVRLFMYLQFLWSLYNVLDLCIFVGVPEYSLFSLNDLVSMVRSVTGWQTSLWELLKAGERGITMARCFNVREGFGRGNDRLPERVFQPLGGGVLEGKSIDKEEFEQALTLYYEMMGWERKNGVPKKAKLHELGIGWIKL